VASSAEGNGAKPARSWDEHIVAAHSLLYAAGEAGLTLRLLGSVGCRLHCEGRLAAFDALGREDPPDLDFAAPARDRTALRGLFAKLGYDEDRDMMVAMEGRRYAYRSHVDNLHVDLFINKLEFCHPIDVTKRFDLDSPTLPVADLLLSKLQIVEINQKDLIDLVVLVLEHDLGSGDRERIDAGYVAKLASEDWGLYYTMSRNVERSKAFVGASALGAEERAAVAGRLDALWASVEAAPKGLKWKLRSKVGARMQWYEDVTEPEPTF
jgi:hypothetical protein